MLPVATFSFLLTFYGRDWFGWTLPPPPDRLHHFDPKKKSPFRPCVLPGIIFPHSPTGDRVIFTEDLIPNSPTFWTRLSIFCGESLGCSDGFSFAHSSPFSSHMSVELIFSLCRLSISFPKVVVCVYHAFDPLSSSPAFPPCEVKNYWTPPPRIVPPFFQTLPPNFKSLSLNAFATIITFPEVFALSIRRPALHVNFSSLNWYYSF